MTQAQRPAGSLAAGPRPARSRRPSAWRATRTASWRAGSWSRARASMPGERGVCTALHVAAQFTRLSLPCSTRQAPLGQTPSRHYRMPDGLGTTIACGRPLHVRVRALCVGGSISSRRGSVSRPLPALLDVAHTCRARSKSARTAHRASSSLQQPTRQQPAMTTLPPTRCTWPATAPLPPVRPHPAQPCST